jgi:seryl-tRNA synthetase
VHQFQKVEQVILDVADKASRSRTTPRSSKNAEDDAAGARAAVPRRQRLRRRPRRPQAMKYDIETWMPSRNATTARRTRRRASTTTRRGGSNMRYREDDGKP